MFWPAALSLVACADGSSPKGAFERMADAAQSDSAADLFDALDDDSRGAVSGLRPAQARILRIIRSEFPPDEERHIPGRWRLGAEAGDTRAVFAAWCDANHCLAELTERLSAPVRLELVGTEAKISTRLGRTYPFSRSPRGRWGLSTFRDRLRRWNVEVYRDLEAVTQSAAMYRRLQ